MEIISVLLCVCVCVPFVAIISTSLRRGGRNLFGQSSEEDKSQGDWLAGGDWASNKRSFACLRLGRDGGVRRAGGALRFLVLSALLFLFTVFVFFVFLIQELVMPFSLSLSRRQHPHAAATSPTQIHPQREEYAGERWMGTYLAQGRSGQVRSGQDERGWNIRYLVVSCWRRFRTACLHAKGAIDR